MQERETLSVWGNGGKNQVIKSGLRGTTLSKSKRNVFPENATINLSGREKPQSGPRAVEVSRKAAFPIGGQEENRRLYCTQPRQKKRPKKRWKGRGWNESWDRSLLLENGRE